MTYLQNTREALAAFDAKKPEREALWQAVVDNETFQAAHKRANEDVAEVQTAFHRDTKGYNCLSDCMKVTVPELRALIVRMDARWAAQNEKVTA